MCQRTGLVDQIDRRLHLLKYHLPYSESDHVRNIAFNALCGGTHLEDLELLRNDEVYMDALGTQRIPDPTTAGDFCRRFGSSDVEHLMHAINRARLKVWKQQPSEFFKLAYVLALAWYLRYRDNYRRFGGLLIPFIASTVPLALILLQPDLGAHSVRSVISRP